MGTQIDFPVVVRDTRFPIAATMIIPQVVGGSTANPDFDLYLLSPSGATLASSSSRHVRRRSASSRP